MMNENVMQMFDFHRWANSTLVAHLKELAADSEKTVSKKVLHTFHHVISVDETWYARLQGISPSKSCKTFFHPEQLEQSMNVFYEEFGFYLKAKDDLYNSVIYKNARGQPNSIRISEIIQHLIYRRANCG